MEVEKLDDQQIEKKLSEDSEWKKMKGLELVHSKKAKGDEFKRWKEKNRSYLNWTPLENRNKRSPN